jgi:lysyl-tRNA synthetase class 2
MRIGSSAIAAVAFDERANTLEVEFRGGRVYRYSAVPRSVVDTVLASESVGAAFNALVRGRYPYVEV